MRIELPKEINKKLDVDDWKELYKIITEFSEKMRLKHKITTDTPETK